MSLLWVEGFEWLGTAVDGYAPVAPMTQKYQYAYSSNTAYLRAGRTGGYALEGIYNSTQSIWTNANLSTASPVYIMGIGVRPHSSGITTGYIAQFHKGSNNGPTFRVNGSTHEIDFYDRGYTLRGSTVGANITSGNWSYVEIKILDSLTGTVEVRVNGQVVMYLANVDTTSSGSVGINCVETDIGMNGSYPCRLDDWYVCNGAGTTNNDFLGNVVITGAFPTSDGASPQWTPSAGTDHYAVVDEIPDTGDTDYVGADNPDTKDTYGFADASDLGTIHGVQTNIVMKEMATAVVPTVKTLVKSNSTVYDQAVSAAITTAYKSVYTINETDPATGAAWTLANLNAAEFGVKRV